MLVSGYNIVYIVQYLCTRDVILLCIDTYYSYYYYLLYTPRQGDCSCIRTCPLWRECCRCVCVCVLYPERLNLSVRKKNRQKHHCCRNSKIYFSSIIMRYGYRSYGKRVINLYISSCPAAAPAIVYIRYHVPIPTYFNIPQADSPSMFTPVYFPITQLFPWYSHIPCRLQIVFPCSQYF